MTKAALRRLQRSWAALEAHGDQPAAEGDVPAQRFRANLLIEGAPEAHRVDGMVLQEEQVGVGGVAEQGPLESVGVVEAHPAEPTGAQRRCRAAQRGDAHSSWDQSRVSRMSRQRARNAEA